MSKRLCRIAVIITCAAALFCMFSLGAGAYSYPSMPSDWENVQVTVGDVTMPLELYPAGSYYDPEKRVMTVEEQSNYGLSVGSDIDLRGWDCVGFARYVYTALFYKYPQDATIDTTLAYSYGNSYAYVNMIEQVFGTRTLEGGYDASTLKTLFTSCQPGAVVRITGHSFVLMAIYDDGFIVYDANFSSANQVDVRAYTWESFVSSLGYLSIEAVQMPAYYPGYSYSTNSEGNSYILDTSASGRYAVTASVLNVRSRPTTTSTVLGTLLQNDIVEIYGTYNGWAQISYNGQTSWVSTDYLTEKGPEVEVTFDANGGRASYTSAAYTAGEVFGNLPSVTKTGRTLLGWSDGTNLYTETSIVPSADSLVLKATWCIQSFQDVTEDDWFAADVETAFNYGLISSDVAFLPLEYATRAHMVTVLAREYMRETGSTIRSSGSSIFTDVPSDSYYAPYVAWGNTAGIVMGIGDDEFQPDAYVTREQIALFLYRLADYTGNLPQGSTDTGLLNSYPDGAEVSGYAQTAVCWAINAGILQGDNLGYINPQGYARRCEMIAMFSRYISYMGG